jgi:hypothetical protein
MEHDDRGKRPVALRLAFPFGLRTAAAMYTPSRALIQVCCTGESASLTTWMYCLSGSAASLPACFVMAAWAAPVTSSAASESAMRMFSILT